MSLSYKTIPLGDVVTISGGATPSKQNPNFWGGAIPWISPKDMKSFRLKTSKDTITPEGLAASACKIIPPGNPIIVVRSGVLRHSLPICIPIVEVALNQDLKALVPDDRMLPRFLAFWLRAKEHNILATCSKKGATVESIVLDSIKALQIPLPPLKEQQRIVEILDQADALRQQRRKADELSQRIIPAIFHEMFGNPATISDRYPVESILDVCSPRQWPTISGKQLETTGFPVFGANGPIGFYSEFNHEHPTIAITCRGATCGTINVTPPKCYITGNAMALDDLDLSKVSIEFMRAFLAVRGFSDVITGAAQPQITRTNLAVIKIPIVPELELHKFSTAVSEFENKVVGKKGRLIGFDTLFQTLLHRAFDGSLTASWRESHSAELLQEMERQA